MRPILPPRFPVYARGEKSEKRVEENNTIFYRNATAFEEIAKKYSQACTRHVSIPQHTRRFVHDTPKHHVLIF